MKRTLLLLAAAAPVVACGSMPDGGGAAYPQAQTTAARESVAVRPPAGDPPQSYTPEAKPKTRGNAATQRWSAQIGRTDHRTTMILSGKTLYVGARGGAGGGAGIYALEAASGAQRRILPAAKGDVVGIAMEGDLLYSSSSTGEVAATTTDGKIAFRASLGSAATTAPTLVDVDGDGKLEVAVGDAKGKVHLLDGATGKSRWAHAVASPGEAHPAIGAGLAAADLDGDGAPEIVAGSETGKLVALRGKDASVAWKMERNSPLRAAPLLVDVDADGKLEVLAAWADGDVAFVDPRSGKPIWEQEVEEDDGDPVGLLASPMPVPGHRVGSLLVPTARWGKEDATVLVRAHYRAYQSQQGRVASTPVLGTLETGTDDIEAVLGTERGDVVSFDATGGVSFLYGMGAPIEASPFIADVDGDGTQDLVVVTTGGKLVSMSLHATKAPLVGRGRGPSPHNTGVLPAIDLGWKLP